MLLHDGCLKRQQPVLCFMGLVKAARVQEVARAVWASLVGKCTSGEGNGVMASICTLFDCCFTIFNGWLFVAVN